MSARSIARELAVIIFPQLAKGSSALDSQELALLIGKAVSMLCDYARQSLSDANALLLKAAENLDEMEIEHPDNAEKIEDLAPVPVNTGQLRRLLELIERALHFVSEALDIPEMAFLSGQRQIKTTCRKCHATSEQMLEAVSHLEVKDFLIALINTYKDNRQQIDDFIKQARAKWKVERMVSVDRDILRLACTEALFMPDIPINVCISEAVELSHRFADERAAKFINGILRDLASAAAEFRKSGVLPNLEEVQASPP